MRIVNLDKLKMALFEADAIGTLGMQMLETFPLESAVSEAYYEARIEEERQKILELQRTVSAQKRTINALLGGQMKKSMKTSCENCVHRKKDIQKDANPYELMATCDNTNVRTIDLFNGYFRCSGYEPVEDGG